MSKIRRSAPSHKKIEEFRRLRGIERKVHFESGGSPSSWRGMQQVTADASKESSKMLCRANYLTNEDDYTHNENYEWANHLGEE